MPVALRLLAAALTAAALAACAQQPPVMTSSRPAVQRGLAVGADLSADPASVTPEEQARRAKLLYNQRARPAPAA